MNKHSHLLVSPNAYVRNCLIILVCMLFLVFPSFAQDFTVKNIGDYGNVTVMEASGNYDAELPDGTSNVEPRQLIAREFLKTHKDEYDFLVIFTNFSFRMPKDAVAFYQGVRNDVRGIGQQIFDNSSLYGSNGKLQGTIDMGSMDSICTDPMDPVYEFTLGTLAHEMLHRWAAYVKFRDWNNNASNALIGKDGSHWSYLLDTKGSLEYGNQWRDNGDGTFTSVAARAYYSPLDLYLMGMIDKSEVPPMLLIDNPAIDPARIPEVGASISGTARHVTIDDVVAIQGERVPGAKDSQKGFKIAFIYVAAPGTVNAAELQGIETVRNGFLPRYSILTDGKGLVQVVSTLREDLPTNPGVLPPSVVPRTLPPSIDDGVKWLVARQQSDGSWTDFALTTERDTTETVVTLQRLSTAQQQLQAGLAWLGNNASVTTDFLARRIEVAVQGGGDAGAFVQELLSRRNPDGGWGSGRSFISNPTDTALALKALARTGYGDQEVVGRAVAYLQTSQNQDGGWSGDDTVSTIQPTAAVATAFNTYRKSYAVDSSITRAIGFLASKQNPDGGFGNSPSTVYDSAVAVMALQEAGADKAIINSGVNYIQEQQTGSGSWQESPYQTALAVRAVWQANVDPDLSLKADDISFIPAKVTTLPTTAVVSAVVWNLGRTDVPQARVAIYDGAVTPDKKVGEQTVAFPGQSPTTVTFSVPVTDGNGHYFHVVIDPDNLVKESNKNNNSAVKALLPEATYDFEVLSTDLVVSPNPVDMYQEVRISTKIANRGTMNAYNVPVRFFIDEPGAPLDIAMVTLDIPAGGTVAREITWKATKAGVNMPLTVQVDPNNMFAELSKNNNKVATSITINNVSLTDPNLTVSYRDIVITPNPAIEGGNAAISAIVRNSGNVGASNVTVNFYRGIPGKDGLLIGTRTIAALPPSGSEMVSVQWDGINEAGSKIIYVRVDPENAIKELAEDDNDAYSTLYVRSLADIVVSANSILLTPAAPREGDVVAITVTVQNRGEQDATNVTIQLKEGNVVVGTLVIPSIAGNSTGTARFTYDTAGRTGVHELTVVIDPDNLIIEQSKDNNSATKKLGVQNSNLWVSEPYFSPNGDGVKDTTDVVFRPDTATSVKIVVVDAQGQTIRTFKDGELVDSSGTVVTWDGRTEDGAVAKDGQYQLQIRDVSNTIIGNVAVVVDNNHSPLKDAIWSNELFKKDIACQAADASSPYRSFWLEDESGYVVGGPDKMWYFPTNGEEPSAKSKKDEWFRYMFGMPVNKSNLSYYIVTPYYYWDPETLQFGFYAWGNEKLYENNYYYYYLGQSYQTSNAGLVWSDDRTKVASFVVGKYYSGQGANSNLSVIDMSGPGPKNNMHNIASCYYDYNYSVGLKPYKLSWSPDSSKLAYWDPKTYEVVITDPSGTNKSTVYSSANAKVLDIKWLDNDRLLVNQQADGSRAGGPETSILLINTNDMTTFPLANGALSPALSNDRTKVLLKLSSSAASVVALDGTVLANINSSAYGTPLWSPTDRYVALQQSIASGNDTINIFDMETNEYHSIERVYTGTAVWYDDDSLLYSRFDNGVALYDLRSKTTKILDSSSRSSISISPFKNQLSWGGGINYACSKYSNYLVSSRLNLSVAVYTVYKGQSLLVYGTAADANFGGWKLEYADHSVPDTWNLVAPPSDVPVVDGVFTSWVPPGEGIYEIRLTVWDKAGNTAISRGTAAWSNRTGIFNIYKNLDAISPNGDGVNDSLEIHYSLPAPVHVDYSVLDSTGTVIKSGYAAPGTEYISWDGRDEAGRIVADGRYTIKLFDVELSFDVDNELPVTSAALTPILKDKDTGLWYAELSVLAHDKNIKNWKVEYAEGEKPDEWIEFRQGTNIVAKKDESGNLLSPMAGDMVARFSGQDLGWLKGKKFRMTAEDFSGNKSSSTTDFVEEKVFLNSWDHAITRDDFISPEIAKPGNHIIGGAETLRLPVTSAVLQYWNGREWSDVANAANSDSGRIDFTWDSSSTGGVEGFAVRAKVQDVVGAVHYSNALSTKSLFVLEGDCSLQLQGQNSLFEGLSLLKIQTLSPNSQWTDFKVYDATKGDVIPAGLFFEKGPDLSPGSEIRMIGVGSSGKVYETTPTPYPPSCPVKFKLLVNYEDAKECGEINPGRVTLSGQFTDSAGSVVFQTLSYYIQKSDGLELLRTYDISHEGWKSHLLLTAGMAEGAYPVKAIVSYLDQVDMKMKGAEAMASVIVDRTAPVAAITYPQLSRQNTCPVKYPGSNGDWYGIHIEGTVTDNLQGQEFGLFYGIGEKPTTWFVAGDSTGQSISGHGAKQGTIGVWNVSNLKGNYSLKLLAKDQAGNISCATASVSFNQTIDLPAISLSPALFSPNQDGVSDNLNINFNLNDSALFDAKVYRLLGNGTLDTVPVRTVVSGMNHLAGSENILWDGKADGGGAVSDGRYGVAVSVRDACGNSMSRWGAVEVDVTPPTVAITYPKLGDALPSGNVIEVKGVAIDAHFQDFTLETGKGENPSVWLVVGSGTAPVTGNVLGTWNTFGLEGKWTLRLSSSDKAGNKSSVTSTLDLGARSNLIKSVTVSPSLFSPNADGKKDTATVTCETITSSQTDISIIDTNGVVVKTISLPSGPAGTYNYIWDGKNGSGAVVDDGYYKVKVHSVLVSDNAISQTEEITVRVDTTPPSINISAPGANAYLNTSALDVSGSISDESMKEYNLKVTGPSGVLLQKSGTQSRSAYTFGTLNDLSEGVYLLTSDAKDAAENVNKFEQVFTIDRTPPKVTLDSPRNGDYFGFGKSVMTFAGSIIESNLDRYSLKIGSGDNPSEWRELAGGSLLSSLPALKVGKDDGISDGSYTIWLYAKDKAALEGEAKVKVIVDNTPPEVAISSINNGDYIKGPIDIMGTAFDVNFDRGLLEMSEGDCSNAFKWATLKVLLSPVKNGLVYSWKALPSDGLYCIRLSAMDKVGGKTELLVPLKVHVQPPPAPVLSGKIENKTTANLSWISSKDSAISGFNVYRNGQKLNAALISSNTYTDVELKQGTYTYSIKAVDAAGNESASSNVITLAIDLTGPTVRMISPMEGVRVSNIVDIQGTAFSDKDFKQYTLYVGNGPSPSSWSEIKSSTLPMSFGTLGQLDTHSLNEGVYSIKLEAEDNSGNISILKQTLTVDKTSPSPPVLLSATATGSNVSVVWKLNSEADLAGYLLMRNGQLVNGAGMSFRDVKPFLLSGTTYNEKLSDGAYEYILFSVDTAGNISGLSNKLSVKIDIGPPHANLVDPASGMKFEGKIRLQAASPDNDIVSLQFQYKKPQESVWTNIGSPLTGGELVNYFDPSSYSLPYGDYQLRAVATDSGGKTDSAPVYITVTYADLTAPKIPSGVHQLTNGNRIAISWDQNPETDLAGYYVYRTVGTVRTKLNTVPIKLNSYTDDNMADGLYVYEITAIDTFNNESKMSSAVSAKVYAPILIQPRAYVDQPVIIVSGANADPDSSVEFFVETEQGQIPIGNTNADQLGKFSLNCHLLVGVNKITAWASDSAGNNSRPTNVVVALYSIPPTAPTGLAVSVEDYNVNLMWNPNPETDIAGYNVYRNAEKLNTPIPVTTGIATASSQGDPFYSPRNAFDGNSSTFWTSAAKYNSFTPCWWEVDLQSPEAVSRLEIHWRKDYSDFSGKDYEIEAWLENQWVSIIKVVGNTSFNTNYDFHPSVTTNKIRIYITDTNNPSVYEQVGITDVTVLKEQLVAQSSYLDRDVSNGRFRYKVSAVNSAGFEGPSSDEIVAEVGDVTPPGVPQGLSVAPVGSSVVLNWLQNSEPDLAGYNVYKITANGWEKQNSSLLKMTNFADANLISGKYRYRVTAVDNVGNESDPTSEVEVKVSAVLPPVPSNLAVIALPEGRKLQLTWQLPGGTSIGNNIYRSLVRGGPYQKINPTLLISPFYLDRDVLNNKQYYYVVEAIDSIGNVSGYSSEVEGIPNDMVPPEKPIIFSPAIAGQTANVTEAFANLVGFAEHGATVSLMRDGNVVASTKATDSDTVEAINIYYGGDNYSVSTDGKYLFYNDFYSGRLTVFNVATGEMTYTGLLGSAPSWSPDSKNVAYVNSAHHIAVYEKNTSLNYQLTSETNVTQNYPSWSNDGRKIIFVSSIAGTNDVWIKDIVTGTLVPVTQGISASYPSFLPNNKMITYFEGRMLRALDLDTGAVTTLDNNANPGSVSWSKDGKNLLYISYDGTYNIKTMNIEALGVTHLIASSSLGIVKAIWSPDAQKIGYMVNEQNGYASLMAVEGNGELRSIQEKFPVGASWLQWPDSGNIFFSYGYNPRIAKLKGVFTFSGIKLDPDENDFSATAIDDSGNTSLESNIVPVFYDTILTPDISVSSKDINFYPPIPKPGEKVTGTIIIKNPTNNSIENVPVEIYLWDTAGALTRLKSETITRIAAKSEETITFSFNAGTEIGTQSIIAIVDPANGIIELDETNNYATREMYVTDKSGISIVPNTNSGEYGTMEDATATITIHNNGPATKGALTVSIVDSDGVSVSLLDSSVIAADFGSSTYTYSWNTGTTFSGTYAIYASFEAIDGTITEESTKFVILPDIVIDTNITIEKGKYNPNEEVSLTVNINNLSSMYIIPEMTIKTAFRDAQNNNLYNRQFSMQNVLPSSTNDLSCVWNTSLNAPGEYSIVVEAYVGDKIVSTSLATFEIYPVSIVTGSVVVDPPAVGVGNSINAQFSVRNAGNVITSGTLKASVIDPDSQMIITSSERSVNLPSNGSQSGIFGFATAGLQVKGYLLSLQYVSQGTQKNLASSAFTVRDVTPPTVTIVSPVSGTTNNETIIFAAIAFDDASGVDTVEYQLDGGTWRLLPLVDPVSGRYATAWNPSNSDNGAHIVSFRATDKSKNTSVPVSVSITFDTQPPVLHISSLSDSASTNDTVLNITGIVTDNTGVQSVTVNGTAVASDSDGSFSYAVPLKNDINTITTVATDLAENRATDTRTITLDRTAPVLTIDIPADNSKAGTALLTVTGSVDATSTVVVKLGENIQTASMNGNTYTAMASLESGYNTIEVTATDLAGKASTQKRTVVYDNQKPSLAVTVPNQDIETNKSSFTVKGTALDPYTSVVVSVIMDGQAFTPPVVNGAFEQVVTFTEEKSYAIIVTATNEVGTATSVQRNIIYTPPTLTINSVTSPTDQGSQTISGTMLAGATVAVSCHTATVGDVSYPTATTWRVDIIGFTAGGNTITVTTSEPAGNTASADIVYSPILPETVFTFAVFGNKRVTMSGGSYTDSYLSYPPSITKGQYQNGSVGTNSLQSCSIQLSGGGTKIFGRARVGTGGNPATGICASGGSLVYNNDIGVLAALKDMAPKTDPGGGTSMGALSLSGITRTLTDGDYRYSSMSLSGGATLTLSGLITLHVDGNLTLSGGSKIVVTTGPVTIYANGQKIDISGGSLLNNTQNPKTLTIYGTVGLTTANLSGRGTQHFLVYAPKAAITLSGGQNTFGSVIGNTVNLSGGSSVHFDQSLTY